jgi:predicted transcriptional regulator
MQVAVARGSARGALLPGAGRRYVQSRPNELNCSSVPHLDLIEKIGIHFEQHALPRIAGRIFGLLLISAEPMSLDQIAERLHVSRASVSVDARRLANMGMIEQSALPGDRRKYYRISEDAFARAMRMRLQSIRDFHSLIASATDCTDPRIRHRLTAFETGARRIIQLIEQEIGADITGHGPGARNSA